MSRLEKLLFGFWEYSITFVILFAMFVSGVLVANNWFAGTGIIFQFLGFILGMAIPLLILLALGLLVLGFIAVVPESLSRTYDFFKRVLSKKRGSN